jgi:3-hydroxymyristoyl/3-hydroxydecanoyl-(acyl carrier protein) dehydratase
MDVVDPEIVRESIAPTRAEFEINVPEELYYLQGHFPQQPILPGVIQIHWAIQLAASRLGVKPLFSGIEALKFHRVIKPLTPLKLTLEQAEKTGKLHFSYLSDLGVHSQGRIVFE